MRLDTFNFMPEQRHALVLGLAGQGMFRDISESLKGVGGDEEIMEVGWRERKEV